jgi:hypothetical protein
MMIGLVHLVWAPLGPAPLREFLRSYHAHPAGAEHELVVVLNGACGKGDPGDPDHGCGKGDPGDPDHGCGKGGPGDPDHGYGASGPQARGGSTDRASRAALLGELEDTEHRLIELEHPVLDLPAYALAARQLKHERLCLLNSYSTILADGWLERLERALEDPGVGVAGASGSWESQAEWARGQRRYWLYQLALLPRARRDYPRFPNPHIRTTAFMLDRLLLLEMGLEQAADKRATYLLESGHRSVTRQLLERELRPVVVGRDGRAYDIEEWPRSATYRAGGQESLLVADRRTRDWERASPRLRRQLARDAWGSGAGSEGAFGALGRRR